MNEIKKYDLEIVAGACSLDHKNINEIYQIHNLGTVSRVRMVGLKSRSRYDETGDGMGIDFHEINKQILNGIDPDAVLPSVEYAQEVVSGTGMGVATEIMIPHIQLPAYQNAGLRDEDLLVWNPSVNQLGWQVRETSNYAEKNGWSIGIKNGKALGVTKSEADNPNSHNSPLEDAWTGIVSFAKGTREIVLIHRGVDIPEKGNQRNAEVHEVARRVKARVPGSKLYFDPSHMYGPRMRDEILDRTITVMSMKDRDNFLYDGLLIETGTSKTDINQHVTISELDQLSNTLGNFRKLRVPETVVYDAALG